MIDIATRAARGAISLRLRLAVLAVSCLAGIGPHAAEHAQAAQPFRTAVTDGRMFEEHPDLAFSRVRAAGASSVRIYVSWRHAAPEGGTKPEDFEPSDPLDPAYDWDGVDAQVTRAVAAGLEPILMIFSAPTWAERGTEGGDGTRKPDPTELGYFAEAAAKRYSGTMSGLPRVRYWQVWNEPNLYRYLMPQYDAPRDQNLPPDRTTKALSPELYRSMLRRFARAIHATHADNLVVAGGLAPFGNIFGYRHAVHPLQFMRELLCMNERNKPMSGCKRVPFDVWAHHPYTEGGPNHSALDPDNVSLGDLPQMRRLLNAAIRAGHISSRRRPEFWVTEFSWETKPPDKKGVPTKLHARWLAEALYRMWQQRVSLVTWFKIRDDAVPRSDGLRFDSGLYTYCAADGSCDRTKRSFTAFRFPFVAFRAKRKVKVWGRTPAGIAGTVRIQQRRRSGWRQIGRLKSNRYGVFRGKLRRAGRGPVRATLVGAGKDRSLPFALEPTRDLSFPIFGD